MWCGVLFERFHIAAVGGDANSRTSLPMICAVLPLVGGDANKGKGGAIAFNFLLLLAFTRELPGGQPRSGCYGLYISLHEK